MLARARPRQHHPCQAGRCRRLGHALGLPAATWRVV